MRGQQIRLTVGERVSWYRRRRGLSQRVLADRVGRTEDWLSKVENNKIQLDRLSVISALATELDVSLSDLLADGDLVEWTPAIGRRTIPALRDALLTYRHLAPAVDVDQLPSPEQLRQRLATVWDAYQDGRFGFMTALLPSLIDDLSLAVRVFEGNDRVRCQRLLALAYQASTGVLTKLGEVDLACLAAQRGYDIAEQAGERVVLTSLTRSVVHGLISVGRYAEATRIVGDASNALGRVTQADSGAYVSVFGTMFLTGAVAAARNDDREAVADFLAAADESASLLGRDDNLLWTAFGPTNVAIHRVAAAMELGDVQQAIDLGPQVDASSMPIERQVRHQLEVAKAFSAVNDIDTALDLVLVAEQQAPEQVRHHGITRDLVLTWMRRNKGPIRPVLAELATRLNVA